MAGNSEKLLRVAAIAVTRLCLQYSVMRRPILGIVLAALTGSLLGTVALHVAEGSILGASDSFRMVPAFTLGTMMFTVPGATMLAWLQVILMGRNWSRPLIACLMIVVGGVVGGLILFLMNVIPLWIAMGALYGTVTACALLSLQLLRAFSPAAAR